MVVLGSSDDTSLMVRCWLGSGRGQVLRVAVAIPPLTNGTRKPEPSSDAFEVTEGRLEAREHRARGEPAGVRSLLSVTPVGPDCGAREGSIEAEAPSPRTEARSRRLGPMRGRFRAR
jgi:hypothetical protein